MPSDKHNSRTARARDLISSLINVASSRDVPFHQPQLLQCLHQGATFDLPFFSSQPRKMTIYGRHEMASVQDIKIDEALFMLCLAYYASPLQKLRRYGFHYGACVSRVCSPYFHNGWMDCRDAFHAVLCLYYCVTDKKKRQIWSILAYGLSNN